MMPHPYTDLPPRAFWKTGVEQTDRSRFPGLVTPRFRITPDTRVATAGSCFAQHIARALREAGVHVLDGEPVPDTMSDAVAERYGYGLFSGRYGNIYTARQLRQLLDEIAAGAPPDPVHVWDRDGRHIDAFRPTIEPDGLASVAEVLLHRDYHLERTAQMLRQADVLIFTLGLTECWEDRVSGRVFPLCPGVAGGQFDLARHAFRNFTTAEVLADLAAIQSGLRRFNPAMRLLLTVSPVPLTATASGDHVMVATARSKAVLRAAAADYVAACAEADYFPSYEIITQPASGAWFAPNLRSVSPAGVARVMSIFLETHGLAAAAPQDSGTVLVLQDDDDADDLVCDELLLQAFAR